MESHDPDRRNAPRPDHCTFVIDCPVNGNIFRTYAEEVLAPTLSPGDFVILDNLSSHKSPAIRAVIEAKGACLIYLSPNSPDLNPIEQFFSMLKAHLRKAACRTVEAVWNAIGSILTAIPQSQFLNYFRNSGYVPGNSKLL